MQMLAGGVELEGCTSPDNPVAERHTVVVLRARVGVLCDVHLRSRQVRQQAGWAQPRVGARMSVAGSHGSLHLCRFAPACCHSRATKPNQDLLSTGTRRTECGGILQEEPLTPVSQRCPI
jgi:hypothetical protein